MSPPDDLLAVGRIATVFGVKGWVKVLSSTTPAENIQSYQPWWICSQQAWVKVEVDAFQVQGKGFVAHLVGIDDRDAARAVCHRDIYVAKSQLPALADNEYYWHELEGLRVFGIGDAAARVLLGEVVSLMETGANDVLVVKSCPDSVDERQRLIPWVSEFLRSVDLRKGEIEVLWDVSF